MKARVQIESDPAGAVISIDDGAVMGQAPLAVELDHGKHVLIAELYTRAPVRQELVIDGDRTIVVRLPEAAVAPTAPKFHGPPR